MTKKNKIFSDIKILEEGYDTQIGKDIDELKKDIKESKKYEEKKWSDMTRLIILLVWIYLYKLFIEWEFGVVYFFISILCFIFLNLGKRKPGELSAYSVFNPNFERLAGTLTSDMIQPGINNNLEDEIRNEKEVIEVEKEIILTKHETNKMKIKEKAKQTLNSLCNCGSGIKYKRCCALNLKED